MNKTKCICCGLSKLENPEMFAIEYFWTSKITSRDGFIIAYENSAIICDSCVEDENFFDLV